VFRSGFAGYVVGMGSRLDTVELRKQSERAAGVYSNLAKFTGMQEVGNTR
jgi:hypothetical protein